MVEDHKPIFGRHERMIKRNMIDQDMYDYKVSIRSSYIVFQPYENAGYKIHSHQRVKLNRSSIQAETEDLTVLSLTIKNTYPETQTIQF